MGLYTTKGYINDLLLIYEIDIYAISDKRRNILSSRIFQIIRITCKKTPIFKRTLNGQ